MMILQEGAKYALLHLIEKDINQLKINGKSEISMRNMPTNSLSKAYNYRLWIVNLNTRYNISSPFRHSLCLGHYFWKKSIYPFIWKLRFLRKNVFSLLVTPILLVSSPLLPVILTLDCKQCFEILVISMFQRE